MTVEGEKEFFTMCPTYRNVLRLYIQHTDPSERIFYYEETFSNPRVVTNPMLSSMLDGHVCRMLYTDTSGSCC